MSRIEIEARFFLFTSLGVRLHSNQSCPTTINPEQMVSELLTHYPLERWYEMHILTREQVQGWLEQALIILTSNSDDCNNQSV